MSRWAAVFLGLFLCAGSGRAEPALVPEAGPLEAPAAGLDPAAVALGVEAADELAAAAAPPPREPAGAIERAWFAPASSLDRRIWRTRRAALELGVWNLDGGARALLSSPGLPVERAQAAVLLAPDLPAAHMELASALWLHRESPLSAIRTAVGAILAFGRHPEAGLWLGGSMLSVLAVSLVGGGVLCIVVVSLLAAPHAAHDFGDLFSRSMPAFARAALLACVCLPAAVLGEGLLGLLLGLLAVGVVYGDRRQRVALLLASAGLVVGAHPVAQLAGGALEGLPGDPVARAALATSRGLALAVDETRLAAAPEDDLLARQGMARLARRRGNLGQADGMYQALLREQPDDLVITNNAANVRLHLGHMESALELYHRALELEESPLVLFNLSQAYGRAFQVDELTLTLERAQALDGDLVADLTRLQGTQPEGFVVDLPIASETLWSRLFDPSAGADFAAELRQPLAPGRLGASATWMGAALIGTVAVGWVLGTRIRPSRWCARCGRRVCPRCHPEVSGGELCGACNRLFYQPEQTDRELRLERIEALRHREARLDKLALGVSILLPGTAGMLARKPLLSLAGALFFALMVASLVWRDGMVPDPFVAGGAGPFAFACVAALAGIAYATVVGASLAARRNL